jgi:hypothetical protein
VSGVSVACLVARFDLGVQAKGFQQKLQAVAT